MKTSALAQEKYGCRVIYGDTGKKQNQTLGDVHPNEDSLQPR